VPLVPELLFSRLWDAAEIVAPSAGFEQQRKIKRGIHDANGFVCTIPEGFKGGNLNQRT
jgi:hypothetical protein